MFPCMAWERRELEESGILTVDEVESLVRTVRTHREADPREQAGGQSSSNTKESGEHYSTGRQYRQTGTGKNRVGNGRTVREQVLQSLA